MKKLVTILSVILMFSIAATFPAYAHKSSPELAFFYGDNIKTFYVDDIYPDTWFIEGTGRTYDLTADNHFTSVYFTSLEMNMPLNSKIIKLGDGITYLGVDIFTHNDKLEDIYIPDSVTEINPQAFAKNTKAVFHCSKGSAAQKYAVDNGIAYKLPEVTVAGDVNSDDILNTKDVLILRKYLANWHVGIELNSADMNGDGFVNMKDLLAMRRTTARIITLFNPEYYQTGKIFAYDLSRAKFDEYTNNPSKSVLDNFSPYIFSKTENGKYQKVYDGYVSDYTYGVFDPEINLQVKEDLLDFIGSPKMIKEFLANNNVKSDSKITNAFIINSDVIPTTILVSLEKDECFITVNESSDDLLSGKDYTYRAYSKADYLAKFKGYDAQLQINGKNVESDHSAVTYYDSAVVPLFGAIKALGADVTWAKCGRSATIKYNGETFEYAVDKSNTAPVAFDVISLKKESNDYNYLMPAPGSKIKYTILDNELMIDSASVENVLKAFGATIKTDFSNHSVNIVK